jgi:hypothetical protein
MAAEDILNSFLEAHNPLNMKSPRLTVSDGQHLVIHQFNFVDPNIEDWYKALKVLLVGLGYNEDNINNYMINVGKELLDETFGNMQ